MYKTKKLALKIFAVGVSALFYAGCTGGAASSSFGSSASSTGADIVPGSSNGVTDPSQFFVGVDSEVNKIAHVHQLGQFSKPCSVTPGSSKQDITCIVDIPEGEIEHFGLSLKYNVPSGMCNYFERVPYWYYNYEVGYGPETMTVTRTLTDGKFTSATCAFDGGPSGLCNAGLEATMDPISLTPSCIYDRSKSGSVNGCLGSYVISVNETNVITSPPSSATTSYDIKGSWGGVVSTIIGGPASKGWPTAKDGYPKIMFNAALAGVFNEIYTVPPTLNSYTHPVANYYNPVTHDHRGFVNTTRSKLPYFIDPIDDLNGSGIRPGQDSYLFVCEDAAQEKIHRVQVYVREWNTRQDFNAYVASNGLIENPDRGGSEEAGSCDGISGPCNDFFDIDDFLASIGGIYDTTAPIKRPSFFEKLIED